MVSDAESLRITIAHGSDEVRRAIADALDTRHRVLDDSGTLAGLRQSVLTDRPDLIVCGAVFPDGDGIEALIEIGRDNPMPAVIVTSARSLELVKKAMRDHVMAYLIEPVQRADLDAAIIVAWSRYQQLRELQEQVEDLREALDHRKLVERAKGVLMATHDISEAEAFARLRRGAQDSRRRMVDIAEEVLSEQAEG